MNEKVLITATLQSHICQFHKPLMKMLKDNGFEVHVAAKNNLEEKNGLKMEYADKVFDIPFERNPFSVSNLKAMMQLNTIFSSNEYFVIHCNTPVGGIVTRLVANRFRKNNNTKVFYTAHGFHFYKGAPKKNWIIFYPIEKLFSRFTDKLITITNEDYEFAKKKFKCNICYIHGVGANSSRYTPVSEQDKNNSRIKLGFNLDDKIIINVGELLPNKNQKAAIIALDKIRERIPNAKLLIAGNGPEKEKLENLIKSKGLEDYVSLLGYTMELPLYIAASDILLTCSYREGLPMNVLEAMMSGKPIIASNNRGHRELVKNGVNGYIVNADDYDSYALRIITILLHDNDFSKNSVLIAEPFKDNNVINELKAVYEID